MAKKGKVDQPQETLIDQAPTEGAAAADPKAPTEVTLTDGRKATFGSREKMQKSFEATDDGCVKITFDFVNGETRSATFTPDDRIQVDGKSIPTILALAGHGAGAKVGDSVASVKEVEDAVIGIEQMLARLKSPDAKWAQRKEGTGGGFSGAGILEQAMVEFTKQSREQVKAFLAAQTDEAKRAYLNDPRLPIKAIADRIRLERAEKKGAVDIAAESARLNGLIAGTPAASV